MDSALNLDKSLLYYINSVWTHPWLDVFFPAITDLHKQMWFQIFFVVAMLVLFIWRFRKWGGLLFLFLLLALGTSDLIGNHAFKQMVQRVRPGDVPGSTVIVRSPYGGYSFVSNHATNMFCMAKYMSEIVPQTRIFFYAIAFLVSYSRVYNGVHYPTDVLAGGLMGWWIGWAWSALARWLLIKLKARFAP